jgi:hypothetical protein
MLIFNVTLTNPWAKEKFNNLFCKSGMLTKNKAWEFEILKHSPVIAILTLNLTLRRRDHAGLNIEFGLFGYMITAQIYDTRHWSIETDNWEIYE